MGQPRVLVVEDRPSVLKLMAAILEREYDVTTAPDGATALSRIASTPFDVVLTDVRMPGANGFKVLSAVEARGTRTAVVMMTAYGNIPDAVAAIRLGAYDYVAKPIDADDLSLVVARAIEHLRRTAEDPGASRASPAWRARQENMEVSGGFAAAIEEARDRASREYLADLMRLFHGNVTQAATRARVTRESLHRVLKKHEIRPEQYRSPAPAGREHDEQSRLEGPAAGRRRATDDGR